MDDNTKMLVGVAGLAVAAKLVMGSSVSPARMATVDDLTVKFPMSATEPMLGFDGSKLWVKVGVINSAKETVKAYLGVSFVLPQAIPGVTFGNELRVIRAEKNPMAFAPGNNVKMFTVDCDMETYNCLVDNSQVRLVSSAWNQLGKDEVGNTAVAGTWVGHDSMNMGS